MPVCLSVRKVYCGKTADWIRMQFRVVRGVGRGMSVLAEVEIVGTVLGVNLGRPIVTNGYFAKRPFPNYLGFLVQYVTHITAATSDL